MEFGLQRQLTGRSRPMVVPRSGIPGLGVRERPATDQLSQCLCWVMVPAADGHEAGPQPNGAPVKAPDPLDVLITGMSQLQQVLLKQKGGETMDLEPKASQAPRVPRGRQISRLLVPGRAADWQLGVCGAADWWQRTLAVAQGSYEEYQSLSPMTRSLPKGVRDALVSHRVQGVHQILFKLMVVFPARTSPARARQKR